MRVALRELINVTEVNSETQSMNETSVYQYAYV